MTKRWILINLALLCVAGLLGWYGREMVRRYNQENDLSAIKPSTPSKSPERPDKGLPPPVAPRKYSPPEFATIVDKNVFSDSRTNQAAEVAPVVVEETPALNPKPILIGTLCCGDRSLATIVDPSVPVAPTGKGRGQIVRLGDVFHGYTVVDITVDRVVLAYGSRREVIELNDTTRQTAKGTRTPIIATRVVNFGGGTAVGTLAAVSVGQTPQRAAAAPVPSAPVVMMPGTQPVRTSAGIVPVAPRPTTVTRGVDTQTNRQVFQTPAGVIVTYPPE